MRAKFYVSDIQKVTDTQENLTFRAVCPNSFDKDGASEDNSFARWTPDGELRMTVMNPNLIGKFTQGQKFYLDFTPAD